LMFESQLIKSLLAVPVIDQEDNTFWGIVGFADCTNEQEWTISEENSLRMLSNNIRNALRRFESHEKLKSAMFQAQAADRAKSEFLASMSHEIRTPMNGVFGMTSLLLHTELSAVQREYVEIIETSGDNLMNIINEILDFSKIESGRMQLENTSFDLRRCVEDVLDLVAPKALEKRLDIIYYIDPEVNQFIFGDGFRLRQIIVNLIGNAIKFTEKGEIYIHIMLKETIAETVTLEFSVKDTGIGIPQDKVASLFSPFMQADASTTRKYGGTGLGLAISSNLVKLMKGTIGVESIEGQGSEFRFTIETRFTTPKAEINPVYKVLQSLPGKNILIVDDNPTNRKILNLQCEFWGMKATTCESGVKALELLRIENKFDVGILDMQMPGMDGIMLAREIRKMYSKTQLPLIMLTSIGYNIQTDDMQNLFTFYVNKPIKHSQLADILLKVLFPALPGNSIQLSSVDNLELLAQRYPFEILVAEDNIINQKMIRKVLQLLGYSCDVVANGLEVIEAVKRKQYELIFMDIQMPEMDGYEATRIIVEHMKNERPIIIAMTANAMSSDREKCIAVGMVDYITKPLKVDDLQKTFEHWGEKQKTLQQV
jgi:signal transduction histidine kinase/DNA-binding response OmpR family regulator